MNEKKLFIFDVDGTLVDGMDGIELIAVARRWLAREKPQNIALCTNQGGVGRRYWMEPRPAEDYGHLPTEAAAIERLGKIVSQVQEITGGTVRLYAAYRFVSRKGNWSPVPTGREDDPAWSTEWRKPGTGMLRQALIDFGETVETAVFVGDMDSDEETAVALGMDFCRAGDFFAIDITFTYPSYVISGFLSDEQRVGLDEEASRLAFEEAIRKEISRWRFVRSVSLEQFVEEEDEEEDEEEFEEEFEEEGDDAWLDDGPTYWFSLSPGADEAVGLASIDRTISDLFINREWLTYESAEAHVRALSWTRWLFATHLMDKYGLSATEARDMTRPSHRW